MIAKITFPAIFRMYQDKLAQLKKQLQLLRENTHPEYNKKLKKLDALYRERWDEIKEYLSL